MTIPTGLLARSHWSTSAYANPIKDGQGHTTQLIVFTSGYVYRFNVLYQQIPSPLP